MSTYPILKSPKGIEVVSCEFPSEPVPPTLPAKPLLLLKAEPRLPLISAKPLHPGDFKRPIPHKLPLKTLGIAEFGVAVFSPLLGVFTNNSLMGIWLFIGLTLAVGFFGGWKYLTFPQRLQRYREDEKKYQQQINDYHTKLKNWEKKTNEIHLFIKIIY